MPRKPQNDPLIEAAVKAGDGHRGMPGDGLDDEQRRVHANLERLATLKRVFAEQSGEHDTSIPQHWGHLRIESLIGEGSFGRVYRAFDPVLQREVALKLRSGPGQDDNDAGFIAEARRLARVRHPNVLAVHGADVHGGRAGLWTDLLEGTTLAIAAASHAPDRGTIAGIAAQLAAALDAIHASGLVHGDVKSSNVMYHRGHATLMDFGAGSMIGVRPRYGTPASMAPELLEGAPASAAGDIYSLAALLHALAIGSLPEAGRAVAAADLRRRLGRPLAVLLCDMLATDPARRPDAAGVGTRLRRLAQRPRRLRRRLAVAVVMAALALGLVVSLIALRQVREARARAEAVTHFMLGSVHRVQPENQHGPATLMALFEDMAGRVTSGLGDHPHSLADMQLEIGQGLSQYGSPQRGLVLARQGAQWLDANAPEALEDRAAAHAILAQLENTAGNTQAAGDEARRAIALSLQRPPSKARTLAIIRERTRLGNLLNRSGHWLEAAEAHRRILANRMQLLGQEAPGLAVDYYNLGSVLYRLNRLDQACAAFDHAERLMPSPGHAAPGVHLLFVRQSLAGCELQRGNFDQVEAQLANLRNGYLKHYPPTHVHVLSLELLGARLDLRTGRAARALARLQALPTEMFDNADARLLLVHALIDNGAFAEARRQALPLRKTMAARTDPRAPYLPALLAWLEYRAGGDPQAARQAIDSALHAMRASGYSGLREAGELGRWHNSLVTAAAAPDQIRS